MTTTTKNTAITAKNWFQIAYESTPQADLIAKRDKVCELCECSPKTFYRWKQKGFIPGQRNLKNICNVFGLDVMTRKPFNH